MREKNIMSNKGCQKWYLSSVENKELSTIIQDWGQSKDTLGSTKTKRMWPHRTSLKKHLKDAFQQEEK